MRTEIALEGMSFYAYHGFYDEEQRAGNRFSIDLKVVIDLPEETDFDNLRNTVNYEELYALVASIMRKPSRLLEQVGKKVIDQVFQKWTSVESAEVSVTKFSPPVGGPCEKSKVTLRKNR